MEYSTATQKGTTLKWCTLQYLWFNSSWIATYWCDLLDKK